MVKELLTIEDFNDFINDGLCVVDFYATWCGPCKMLAPNIEKLSEMGIKCGKIDIDKNTQLALNYGIEVIPYVIVFKNGNPIDKTIGYSEYEELLNLVNKNL